MNIAYSCDDNYIEQTGISILSLCENNKDIDDINFYLISKDISENNIGLIKDITDKYGRNLIVIPFDKICYDLNISKIGRHIATIYSKVFFSRIEGLEKIIYFDSDIVIDGSLKNLWEMDLTDCYLGAVVTPSTKSKVKSELGLSENYKFFNDGMAIVNVNYCRENNLIEKVKNVIDEFDGAPPVLSEGALNKVCQGHVAYISPRYNLMSGILQMGRSSVKDTANILDYSVEDIKESIKNPIAIHFLTIPYNRPWIKECNHPFKEKYLRYKEMTVWNLSPLKSNPLDAKSKFYYYLFQILGLKRFWQLRAWLNRN